LESTKEVGPQDGGKRGREGGGPGQDGDRDNGVTGDRKRAGKILRRRGKSVWGERRGDAEKWITEKSREMGVDDMRAGGRFETRENDWPGDKGRQKKEKGAVVCFTVGADHCGGGEEGRSWRKIGSKRFGKIRSAQPKKKNEGNR